MTSLTRGAKQEGRGKRGGGEGRGEGEKELRYLVDENKRLSGSNCLYTNMDDICAEFSL